MRVNARSNPTPADQWLEVTPLTLGSFSAACWYAGKRLYESRLQQTDTPLGLLLAAVGGSPIEYWVPPVDPHDVNKNPCYEDRPQAEP